MKKIYYNKLIRDNIPEIIKEKGGKYETRELNDKEYEKELKIKLLEESKEIIKSPKNELVNELSDVLEIIKSIASLYNIEFQEVEKHQVNKRKKVGSFKKKLFLIWSSDK